MLGTQNKRIGIPRLYPEIMVVAFAGVGIVSAFSNHRAEAQTPAGSSSYHICAAAAGGVTTAILSCQQDELAVRNARLNAAYRQAMHRSDTVRRAKLRTEERTWIKQRDATCRPDAQADAGGTASAIEAQDCVLKQTTRRAEQLQAMR